MMERDGRKFQTIECDQFQDPRGVAVASDGAVYVTDTVAKCLFKLNSKGKLLKTVHNELQKPLSVKIIGNRVYVVDYASQLVKIFDMDCNVVGTIQTKECPGPRDIEQGPDGLYVAGERKISVYRCAPNGVFIRHLNLTPSSLKLSEFNGICIDTSGHIIVSDHCHGVYVLRASGECVGHVSRDVIPGPARRVTTNCHVITSFFVFSSKVLWFESQLILNDFDSAAIAGVDQLCEPSVL